MLFFSKIIYSLFIQLYHFVATIISPFNEKAYRFSRGRMDQTILKEEKQTVWFHCSSLGEFEQAKPLMEWFHQQQKFPIILTFFSPSGYQYKHNYSLANNVYYLPKDSALNARDFIHKINPKFVFFIKYEFWFHYLNELKKEKIQTYLVAGIFRENQLFFKSYGKLHQQMLLSFTHLFVQNKESINLLQKHGFSHCSLANDTRFDTVYRKSRLNFQNNEIEEFIGDKACMVIGSSWLKDEQLIANNKELLENYKLIIAPHDISANRINQVKRIFPNSSLISDPIDLSNKAVLIIDNVGKLSLLYRYADVCYIGGGFGVSVHNVLEAAVYGKALLYGPNHTKSKEAVDLIALGAAQSFNDGVSFSKCLQHLSNQQNLAKAGELAAQYVKERTGGTETVVEFLGI